MDGSGPTTVASGLMRTIADTTSQSKEAGWTKARNHFNKFLVQYKTQHPEFVPSNADQCTESHISLSLMQHFAAYLEDNLGQFNTARTYYSSTTTYLSKRFPSLKASLDQFGTDCQKDIKKHFVKKSNITRTPLTNHHIPVNYDDNIYLCRRFFEKNLHEESALQALDWSNCGRISEAPGLQWCDIRAIEEVLQHRSKSCIQIHWFRGKTSILTASFNFIHATDWLACTYHSLARLIILLQRTDDHIFPRMLHGNVVNHMNGLMKKVHEEWAVEYELELAKRIAEEAQGIFASEGLYEMSGDLTTHGNRSGSITHGISADIPEEIMEQRSGLVGTKTVKVYESTTWAADSKVRNEPERIYCSILLKLCFVYRQDDAWQVITALMRVE